MRGSEGEREKRERAREKMCVLRKEKRVREGVCAR
jgi:hypothetical protein